MHKVPNKKKLKHIELWFKTCSGVRINADVISNLTIHGVTESIYVDRNIYDMPDELADTAHSFLSCSSLKITCESTTGIIPYTPLNKAMNKPSRDTLLDCLVNNNIYAINVYYDNNTNQLITTPHSGLSHEHNKYESITTCANTSIFIEISTPTIDELLEKLNEVQCTHVSENNKGGF